jgi:hypothetical protein
MSSRFFFAAVGVAVALTAAVAAERPDYPPTKIDPQPKPIASDPSVKIDYDIVSVRAPRFVPGRDGKPRPSAWPEIAHPTNINAGYDLMLLHPDGKEEVLVEDGEGSVAVGDPRRTPKRPAHTLLLLNDVEILQLGDFDLGPVRAAGDFAGHPDRLAPKHLRQGFEEF